MMLGGFGAGTENNYTEFWRKLIPELRWSVVYGSAAELNIISCTLLYALTVS